MGLDVELAMVGAVLRRLRASGVSEVRALAVETDANKLSRDLWARAAFVQAGPEWRATGEADPSPPHVQVAPSSAYVPAGGPGGGRLQSQDA